MTKSPSSKNSLSVKTLLNLLDIKVTKAAAKQDYLQSFLASGFVSSWPSLILFSIGCWLAALALGDGVLAFIGTNFSSEEENRFTLTLSSLIGAGGIAAAYLIFISFKGIFPRMLAISTALGSEYLIVMAIAGEGYSFFWATVAALVLLVLMAKLFTDAAHQIGSAAIFCTILTFLVSSNTSNYFEPIMIVLTLPVAIGALFYPMKGLDLRPLGMVFLLCPLIIALYNAFEQSGDLFEFSDTISRIVYMAFYALLIYLSLPALSGLGRKFVLIIFLPILLFSLFTSSGIAASFLIIFIAYILKSRLVMSAGIGIGLLFTAVFYFNLDLPTEEKSAILLISGIAILLIMFILKKSVEARNEQD